MAPKPPTLGSAAAKPWRSSGSRTRPRNGPQTPNARERRGKAVALLGIAHAAPKWPPNPQRSEAPRQSRGAPRDRARGPEMALLGIARAAAKWPPNPATFGAPRQSRGAPRAHGSRVVHFAHVVRRAGAGRDPRT